MMDNKYKKVFADLFAKKEGKKQKKAVESGFSKIINPCKSIVTNELQGLFGARDLNRKFLISK
jgi:hypothetical protein